MIRLPDDEFSYSYREEKNRVLVTATLFAVVMAASRILGGRPNPRR